MILNPATVGPILGVDPAHPRLGGVCAAADELTLAYLEVTVIDPVPAAVVEAATHIAAWLWHLPDLPGGTAGSPESGTIDLPPDVFAHVRGLLWPWRQTVGIV